MSKSGKYWDEGIVLVSGCTPCSPACQHDDGFVSCWALGAEKRFPAISAGGEQHGAIRIHPERLDRIHKAKAGKVYAIWNDLMHDSVPRSFILDVLEAIGNCGEATFVILTKRPARISFEHLQPFSDCPNIYLGVTAENQEQWDKRVPILCRNWPGKKIVSIEPALGRICMASHLKELRGVIAGAETGPGARPTDIIVFRDLWLQCEAANVPFFLKATDAHGNRELDGKTHDDLPWPASAGSEVAV
jgi:protein gp37